MAHPIGHTLSPLIHNMLAEMTGQNFIYVPFDVAPEEIGTAVQGAKALNLLGMNATIPHKEAVIPYLKEIDPLAEQIGAVNTLVRTKDGSGYRGYNTDMTGLYRSLQQRGVSIEGEDVILLGAGGVARAVAFLMASKGARRIYILNRTVERASEVAREVSKKIPGSQFEVFSTDEFERIPAKDEAGRPKKYLCVQCTSVGMYPDNEKVVIEDPAFYALLHTGFDLVYRPLHTKFMELAEKAGAKTYNGLEMLLYQGVDAYELWTGISVTQEQCDMVYKALLEKMENQKNLVLVGYMGSGKSTVSAALSKILDYERLDTDSLIEESHECSIADIFAEEGEESFRKMETRQLQIIAGEKHQRLVLATGGGLPLRGENRKLLTRIGTVIYLKASPETVYERVKEDTARPLLQVEDPKAKIADMLEQRDIFYEMAADWTVSTDGKTPEEIAEEIIAAAHLK